MENLAICFGIALVVFIGPAILLAYLFHRAPMGCETEQGFQMCSRCSGCAEQRDGIARSG